jgi:hypothetical protein
LGTTLGSPFITTGKYVRSDLPVNTGEFFVNNRVMLVHLGGEGGIKGLNYFIKASWSRNFGTYATTSEEQSTDIPNPGEYGIFGVQDQLSGFLEINRNLNRRINIGLIGAYDLGELYYNSFGLLFKASYIF